MLAPFPVTSLNHDLPALGNPISDSIRSDHALAFSWRRYNLQVNSRREYTLLAVLYHGARLKGHYPLETEETASSSFRAEMIADVTLDPLARRSPPMTDATLVRMVR